MPLISNLLSKDVPQLFYKFQLQIYSTFYLVGILGLLYLASPIFSRRTYLSENALSPGLVSSDLYISNDDLRQMTIELRAGFKSKNVTDVIQSILKQRGVEAYKQSLRQNSSKKNEENVYGIVRALRTASTESIILVAPLNVRTNNPNQQYRANIFGIVHTLAIGLAFKKKPYMAKDLILLFPEGQERGTQTWLDAYYNTDPDILPLEAHAGSIQAGLALEFPDEKFFSIDLRHNGINGQLANLDLLNTLIHLCGKYSIATSLYNVYIDLTNRDHLFDYFVGSIRTLLLNVLTLATGVPDGVHGQFLHYRIEMITIFGNLNKYHEYQNTPISIRAFDDIIEGFIRSLNNLMERFHQSFFFYLHINHHTFVSISTYMVPLGLIVLPALIRALVLYMSFFRSNRSARSDIYIIYGRTMNFSVDFWAIVCEVFQCFGLSCILMSVPLRTSLLTVWLVTMYFSPIVLRPVRSKEQEFDYYQFILLLSGCAVLGCLSLLNYSLALLVACFLMPCYFFAGASKYDFWLIRYIVRFIFIVILNPLTFLFIYHYLTLILKAGTVIFPDFNQFSKDIDFYFASYGMLNVWTVDVLCLIITPIWLSLYRSTYWIRVQY